MAELNLRICVFPAIAYGLFVLDCEIGKFDLANVNIQCDFQVKHIPPKHEASLVKTPVPRKYCGAGTATFASLENLSVDEIHHCEDPF